MSRRFPMADLGIPVWRYLEGWLTMDDLSRTEEAGQPLPLPKVGLWPLTELLDSNDSALQQVMRRVLHETQMAQESYTAFGNSP
jgi:FXSXX-COOH protein